MKNKLLNLGLISSILLTAAPSNANIWSWWDNENEETRTVAPAANVVSDEMIMENTMISDKGVMRTVKTAQASSSSSGSKRSVVPFTAKQVWSLWANEDEEANFSGRGPVKEEVVFNENIGTNSNSNSSSSMRSASYSSSTVVNTPMQQYAPAAQAGTSHPKIIMEQTAWESLEPSLVMYSDQIPGGNITRRADGSMVIEASGPYQTPAPLREVNGINTTDNRSFVAPRATPLVEDGQLIFSDKASLGSPIYAPQYMPAPSIEINPYKKEVYNAIDYDTYQYEKLLSSQEIYNAIHKWDASKVNTFWENYRGNNVRVELLNNGRDIKEARLKFIPTSNLHSNADGSIAEMLGKVAEKVMKNVCGKRARQSIILYERPSAELVRETPADGYKILTRGTSVREYGFRCIY